MPFIDKYDPDDPAVIDTTAIEGLDFNNRMRKENHSIDVSLDTKLQGQISDRDVIKQSIMNLLLTATGERLFNLDFGSNIFAYLFSTASNFSTVPMEIVTLIKKYEKRVHLSVQDVIVDFNTDEYWVNIDITYYILSTKEIDNISQKLYL